MKKFMKKIMNFYQGIKFEKLIKFGIAAILISVPLYPKFPFLRIPGTYVSIRLEDFVVFIVAAIWSLSIIPRGGR